MGHRTDAGGKPVKWRVGEPEDFGREDLIFLDDRPDLLGRRCSADRSHGGEPLYDMGECGKVSEFLDPVAKVSCTEWLHSVAGSSCTGIVLWVARKCVRSVRRIIC